MNRKSKFGLCHTSIRDLWWFSGAFYGAKILKSEQDFQNILKFAKHNLTNNFARNFDIYSNEHNRIQAMQLPFKGPVTTCGYFLGKNNVKTKYNLKNISKYDKNTKPNNL